MDGLSVEYVDISTLISDPVNARRHDEKNLSAIKGSLAKFGQQKPIVVTADNLVVAGNGTLEAAKQLGWGMLYVARTNLSGQNLAAYALADNRSGELADWDIGVLTKYLSELDAEGFDLNEIGWSNEELENLLVPNFSPGAPEEPKETQTKCPQCGHEFGA